MSLLSLEKYLYGPHKAPAPAPPASAPEPQGPPPPKAPGPLPERETPEQLSKGGYHDLSTRIMATVGRSVLTGEALADVCRDLDTLRESLRPDTDSETLNSVAQRFGSLMEAFRDRLRQADQERADDFRKALSILNEAFTHLTAGGDRSDVRLKNLESSLQSAMKVESLTKLKTQLSGVMDFVRSEAQQERDRTQKALTSLSTQIRSAQTAASRFQNGLESREEAFNFLSSELGESNPESGSFVALFVADPLEALRSRHGNEIAHNLLVEFSQQQIHSLVPNGRTFCWSPNSVLLVFRDKKGLEDVTRGVVNNLKSPFEYRAFVGTRVATFNITLRSVVMENQGGVEEIVRRLDHFEGRGAVCR